MRTSVRSGDLISVREQLIRCGTRIVQLRLVAGAGGNISAREGGTIWMKPSGMAMDEMTADDLCGLDLTTGRQIHGRHRPTSEYQMHLGIYKMRADVQAVFHTHSPWASGVISAGVELRPMFAEFINDLGRTATLPYLTPTTKALADAVAACAKEHDTIFLVNHGVLALGATMKQALYRCMVAEDAAISMVAACAVGRPQFLTDDQIKELMALDAPKHRVKMMERGEQSA